jgi:glyoxylase-like metal-dependent hydrolase (beta-lactamase superfamily II)
MHPLDAPLLALAVDSALRYGFRIEAPPTEADVDLAEGDRVRVGSLELAVMHVPGHAPGHIAVHGEGVVFGGDCLFAGSVGRTDIDYGDPEALDDSLQRLTALGDALTLYPGHGPITTIGRERGTNPFLLGAARLVRVKR